MVLATACGEYFRLDSVRFRDVDIALFAALIFTAPSVHTEDQGLQGTQNDHGPLGSRFHRPVRRSASITDLVSKLISISVTQ